MILCFDQWLSIGNLVISLLVAFGTISLAFVAFWGIRQTSKQQRDAKIDEVINWAKSVKALDFSKEDDQQLQKAKNILITSWLILGSMINKVINLRREGENLADLVISSIKDDELYNRINDLITNMGEYEKDIGEMMIGLNASRLQFDAALNVASTRKKLINALIDKIIQIAMKLKSHFKWFF